MSSPPPRPLFVAAAVQDSASPLQDPLSEVGMAVSQLLCVNA